MELREFGIVGDDLAVRGKSWTEDICDQNEIVLGADGTDGFRAPSHSSSSTHQFWMGITNIFATEATPTEFVDQGTSRHAVVDES